MEREIIKNSLCTTNYTVVKAEAKEERKYNAPHHFTVENVETGEVVAKVDFQEGPIKEVGINGLNNEDVILMVITRLQGFQDSPYKCRENEIAIQKLEESLMWLRKRTNDREVRGVKSTSQI